MHAEGATVPDSCGCLTGRFMRLAIPEKPYNPTRTGQALRSQSTVMIAVACRPAAEAKVSAFPHFLQNG